MPVYDDHNITALGGGWLPSLPGLPDFSMSDSSKEPPRSVKIKDVPGNEFILKGDGTITIVSTGQAIDISTETGRTMLANLADVPGNKAKMSTVISKQLIEAAQRTPRLPAPVDEPESALPENLDAGLPLTERSWFWPAAILGGAAIVGAAIVFWPRR